MRLTIKRKTDAKVLFSANFGGTIPKNVKNREVYVANKLSTQIAAVGLSDTAEGKELCDALASGNVVRELN